MTKPLCVYHGNCADGFGAAWAVWKFFGGECDFHSGVYQNDPPDVAGRDVIMVDFSYKRAVLEEMARLADTIVILDHHKSAAEDLAGLPPPLDGPYNPSAMFDWQRQCNSPNALHALFDMDRSGAGITWDYFHDIPRPALIDHIEDYDLWRFKLSGTREIQAALFSYPYNFEVWDDLMQAPLSDLAAAGEAIERKHHKDVAELVAVCKRRLEIGGHVIWAASLPYTLTSDAGHLMAQGEPFAACYWDTPEGRVFSLRSTDDGMDVSEIAKLYGGGGHKNAAGFRVPLHHISKFEPTMRDSA